MKTTAQHIISFLTTGILAVAVIFVLSASTLSAGNSTFSSEVLKSACQSYILSKVKDAAVVTISKDIKDVVISESEVHAKCTGKADSFRGNCFCVIEFYKSGNMIKRLEVPVRVKLYREVFISTASLEKGKIINAGDIRKEKKEITRFKESELISESDLLSAKIKRNIPEGQIITNAYIEEVQAVSRGQKIKIISESGAVRIQTEGEALQDGTAGETIRVRREGTRSVLHGRIAKDGTVFIRK